MDQTDPARDLDPLRRLAEAALARQDTAQRQRADDQAAVDNSWPPRCSGPRVPSWPLA